jgi:hypothetical protein
VSTDRIPVLVFDDGTTGTMAACERALEVASELVVPSVRDSPNRDAVVALAERKGVGIEVVPLDRHEGIRHALALCADRGIYLAHVPAPERHHGEALRKCVQAVGRAGDETLPALAVRFVRPDAAGGGPVVEITPARTDAGFVTLFAIGLAISTGRPLHIVRLADDAAQADEAAVRAAEALDAARRLIARDVVPVLDELQPSTDWVAAALSESVDCSALVAGLGGLEVRGRKLSAPDELPDAVLRTSAGHLVHELLRLAESDVIVVIDAISIARGLLPAATAATTVAAAMGTGAATGVPAGLAVVTAGLAASAAGFLAPGAREVT